MIGSVAHFVATPIKLRRFATTHSFQRIDPGTKAMINNSSSFSTTKDISNDGTILLYYQLCHQRRTHQAEKLLLQWLELSSVNDASIASVKDLLAKSHNNSDQTSQVSPKVAALLRPKDYDAIEKQIDSLVVPLTPPPLFAYNLLLTAHIHNLATARAYHLFHHLIPVYLFQDMTTKQAASSPQLLPAELINSLTTRQQTPSLLTYHSYSNEILLSSLYHNMLYAVCSHPAAMLRSTIDLHHCLQPTNLSQQLQQQAVADKANDVHSCVAFMNVLLEQMINRSITIHPMSLAWLMKGGWEVGSLGVTNDSQYQMLETQVKPILERYYQQQHQPEAEEVKRVIQGQYAKLIESVQPASSSHQ